MLARHTLTGSPSGAACVAEQRDSPRPLPRRACSSSAALISRLTSHRAHRCPAARVTR